MDILYLVCLHKNCILINMKGIEKIKYLTDDQIKLLCHSSVQYRRCSKVYIEVIKLKKNTIQVKIKDRGKYNVGDKRLTNESLTEIAQKVFEDCMPEGMQLHIFTIASGIDLSIVGPKYINDNLNELGLTSKDLVNVLQMREPNVKRMIYGKRRLMEWHKSALYQYFERQK